ncbi:hypothetical protein [Planctomicrobium sp. SH664]|uniref:hypothetical protein n=1 Tax=Planctomicrobium sp. SH664 TaxID=3448125 RepID=UPI003F5BA3DB
MKPLRPIQLCGMLAVSMTTVTLPVEAGCPCQGGGGGQIAPIPMQTVDPIPMTGLVPGGLSGAPVYAPPPAPMVQPPPGTLGRTYQMKSRPVPSSMHPRTAMLDVRVKGASEMLVHDMNQFRTEDSLDGFQDPDDPSMWHFQSQPLWPGIPHIYRIEARFDGPDGVRMEQRYVRLIMGRLIEVEF